MIDPLLQLAPVHRAALGTVLGAIAGSFLATLTIRWPQGRSVAAGRSRCDGCHRRLAIVELVPIVSFLVQRGRCRACGANIDRRHPTLELIAMAIGLASMAGHPGWAGLAGAVFGWWLLALAMLDLSDRWLPDLLTVPLLGLGLVAGWLGVAPSVQERAIGALAGYVTLAGVALAYRRMRGREGMGGGDPKLFGAIGAWLGWEMLPIVLFVASMLGLIAAALLLARGRRIVATSSMPFGLLLALASWPIWLLGTALHD